MTRSVLRVKVHFVNTVEDERAACGVACRAVTSTTTIREDVTCSKCKLLMAGKRAVEDGEDWDDYSLSRSGRKTTRW